MLESKKTLLMVTDIQGKLARLMFQRDTLYKNVAIMIEGIKVLNIPILWIEQYPEGLGPTVPEIASHLEGYIPLSKKTFSSLRDPKINQLFTELAREQVILTGIETHVCIQQTAMDALSRGIEIHIVADAVSSRTEYNKNIGLAKIAHAGGHITSLETALFELLEIAEGDVFKKILELVK